MTFPWNQITEWTFYLSQTITMVHLLTHLRYICWYKVHGNILYIKVLPNWHACIGYKNPNLCFAARLRAMLSLLFRQTKQNPIIHLIMSIYKKPNNAFIDGCHGMSWVKPGNMTNTGPVVFISDCMDQCISHSGPKLVN